MQKLTRNWTKEDGTTALRISKGNEREKQITSIFVIRGHSPDTDSSNHTVVRIKKCFRVKWGTTGMTFQ